MNSRVRWVFLTAALLALAPSGGCLQEDVNAVRTGKEFQVEESLISVRKSILSWQTNPKNGDQPLPNTLAEFGTVDRDLANAPNGMWMGYYFRFLKSGDNQHYVLCAYPANTKGINGQRAYFLDEMGSGQSHEFPEGFDYAGWDYDSIIKDFQALR